MKTRSLMLVVTLLIASCLCGCNSGLQNKRPAQERINITTPAVHLLADRLDSAKEENLSLSKNGRRITVRSSNCWIEQYSYDDDRMFTTADLSDVSIWYCGGNPDKTEQVALIRKAKSGAMIVFTLTNGQPGRDTAFGVADTNDGPVEYFYNYGVRFRAKNEAKEITVIIDKHGVVSIDQTGPGKIMRTFFRREETQEPKPKQHADARKRAAAFFYLFSS